VFAAAEMSWVAGIQPDCGGFAAITDAQLSEKMNDMAVRCAGVNSQSFPDFLVCSIFRKQGQHFAFAFRILES
jgi:hypothetical protein